MVRKSTHAARRRFGSHVAMAFALAAGGALGAAALAAPAYAQDDKKKETNSRGFAEAYEPFGAIINDPAGDYAAAKAMVPTVRAAVENNLDKAAMGNAMIALGGKLSDKDLQRQGITLTLESGHTAPEQVGVFHYYLGRWAYEDGNYAEARRQYEQSMAAGYTEGEPDALIVDTYFREGQNAEGLRYLSDLIEKRRAAGTQIPDNWYLRGLKVAYDARMLEQANDWAARLIVHNPTAENWGNALSVVNALNSIDTQSQLDLLRLMRLTDTLSERGQFAEYVEIAAANGLPAEVIDVLADGVAEGVFTTSDEYYTEARGLAQSRAEADRREVPGMVDEARAAPTGRTAYGAANAFYSLGSWAEAEDMYKVAIEKGVEDRHLALTRLGMAQIHQGKTAEAKATLAQVAGPRAPVAKMWIAYADAKAAAGG